MTGAITIKSKKKQSKALLYGYEETLTLEEAERLHVFFQDLKQRVLMPKVETRKLLTDYDRAFLYYKAQNLSLEQALKRLSLDNLGGFYARPPTLWYPLDHAAKVYPLAMKNNRMSIFRFSAEMTQPVVPEILQMALTFTIKRFPFFATTIKKGFFWHYIDSTKKRFSVRPETDMPCRRMNVSATGSRSFRVLYFGNRISVEFFHVLTDGTGAIIFLKTLIAEYLRLLGIEIPCNNGVLDINEPPRADECSSDFPMVEPGKKGSGFADSKALQMSGKLSTIKPCRILHFEMNSDQLRAAAKSRNATVSAFVIALMFIANKAATDETRGDIKIQVPVNMRSHYTSNTLRNFSQFTSIKIPIDKVEGPDELIPEIIEQLKKNTSKEAMDKMMTATVSMVKQLRFVPLVVKRPAALLVYGFLSDRVFSNTLSNLGLVKMPEEMQPYIEKMDVVMGTAVTNRASCAMMTVGNIVSLSISKLTADPSFENKLYELLKANGVDVTVKGSELYGH